MIKLLFLRCMKMDIDTEISLLSGILHHALIRVCGSDMVSCIPRKKALINPGVKCDCRLRSDVAQSFFHHARGHSVHDAFLFDSSVELAQTLVSSMMQNSGDAFSCIVVCVNIGLEGNLFFTTRSIAARASALGCLV